MATDKIIYLIAVADLTTMNSKQIGVETVADADLGFKMCAVKNDAGELLKLITKGQPALLGATTINGGILIAEGGSITLCASGVNPLSSGSIVLSRGLDGELLQEVVA